MCLFKRGRIWWSKIMIDGDLIQRSTKMTSKDGARKVEAMWEADRARGGAGIMDKTKIPTLAGFEDRFFAYVQDKENRKKIKPRTVAFYRETWRVLMSFAALSSARLDKIDSELITEFTTWYSKDHSPDTVNGVLRTLRHVLHVAKERKLLREIPKIGLFSKAALNVRDFLITEERLADMLSSPKCTPLMRRLLPFLIDTGLRIGEACDLTWDRVSFEPTPGARYGYISIDKGKTKAAKRDIPLLERPHQMLKAQRSISTCEYVWAEGTQQMDREEPSRRFRQIRKALGWPKEAVLHSTRHAFCTRLGVSGCDSFTFMKLAGHSDLEIAKNYVHPPKDAQEDAMYRMSAPVATLEAKSTSAGSALVQ